MTPFFYLGAGLAIDTGGSYIFRVPESASGTYRVPNTDITPLHTNAIIINSFSHRPASQYGSHSHMGANCQFGY